MKIKTLSILLALFGLSFFSYGQERSLDIANYNEITNGADRTSSYIKLLNDKNVAVVANHASMIKNLHLVDSLLSQGVNIITIFCPEHGFRGKADAGEKIQDGIDTKTGIPIVSLYGSHKKPTPKDLKGIDIVLFDLQDVGTRFYTYISTLTYVMEACAEQNVPIIVLDRPNPNGYFVDGPILDSANTSFVGLHPVPIVYGMTIGEYALMVEGEGWINKSGNLDLRIIRLEDYNHNMIVKLNIKPSPNLPNWQAVYLYPSLCLFEGTIMSVGRGTDTPFQLYGHPDFMIGSLAFTPESNEGASNPKYKGENCYGISLDGYAQNFSRNDRNINLSWLIGSYEIMNRQGKFFNNYFKKLAGTSDLQQQIENGISEEEIRKSWQPGLEKFKITRSKYLLYD